MIHVGPTGQWLNLATFEFGPIIGDLITLLLVISAIVFVFMLLWGGLRWISAGSDKAQVESARSTMTNALIGVTILFATWAVVNLIELFFGVELIDLAIPTA